MKIKLLAMRTNFSRKNDLFINVKEFHIENLLNEDGETYSLVLSYTIDGKKWKHIKVMRVQSII